MKAKTRFILKIVCLTLVMIAGLTLVMMMGVMMAVDEAIEAQRISWLLLGLLISIFAFAYLMKINRAEEKRRVDETINQEHEYIGQWKVPAGQWRQFLDKKLAFQQADAKNWGWTIGIVLGVVVGIIAYSNYSITDATIITLVVVVLGFAAGWAGARKKAIKIYDRDSQFTQCEVFFAESLIVLNGRLVQVKDFGVRPLEVSLKNQFEQKVLAMRIQVGVGNRKSVKEHWIPVPKEDLPLAEQMCTHYQTLI